MSDPTQHCPACALDLPLDAFPAEDRGRSARACTACQHAVAAAHLAGRRQHRAAVRARAAAVYGGRCVACGATSDLEFDHVDVDGAEHRRAERQTAMLARIARSGAPLTDRALQLLCTACHRQKTHGLAPNPLTCTNERSTPSWA